MNTKIIQEESDGDEIYVLEKGKVEVSYQATFRIEKFLWNILKKYVSFHQKVQIFFSKTTLVIRQLFDVSEYFQVSSHFLIRIIWRI